jgi:hypothetical protein
MLYSSFRRSPEQIIKTSSVSKRFQYYKKSVIWVTHRADLADRIGRVPRLIDGFVPVAGDGGADGVAGGDVQVRARRWAAAADLADPVLRAAVGALFCGLSGVAGRGTATDLAGAVRLEA